MKNYKLRIGFTLAEVLITLGIIGIVAAMTIPTLVKNYQEKVTVTRLKEAYSMMSNAYGLIRANEGPVTSWFGSDTVQGGWETDDDGNTVYNENLIKNADTFWDKFEPYLKVVKRCKGADQSCQKYDNIYTLDGARRNTDLAHTPVINLTNGVTLLGGYTEQNCGAICGDFAVDINGMDNKPNTLGKDIFYFYITNDAMSILPMGRDIRPFSSGCNPEISGNYSGYGCTAWVIENKNLDYLECFDKLDWNGSHSCND